MPAPPARPLRRACLLLFVAAAGLYATSPVVTNWDSYLAVPSAYSLLHHGDLDLDEFHEASIREHYGFYAHDGRHFDFYGWPQAVLALPVVAVVDLAGSVGIGPGVGALIADDRMAAIQLVSASLLTAAVVVLVSMAAFGQLPGPEPRRRRLAIGIGAVFAVATPAWSTASRALWQHGPSMAALAVVVIAAGRLSAAGAGTRARRRAALLLGASVAAAFAVRPTNVVAGVVVSLWVLFGARRELGRFAGGALLVGVPFVAVNLAVYGSTLPPSHQTGAAWGTPTTSRLSLSTW